MITKFDQSIATILSEAILKKNENDIKILDNNTSVQKIIDGLIEICMIRDNNNLGYDLLKETIEKILFGELKE